MLHGRPMPMPSAAEYSVKETLHDGSIVEIRAQRHEDQDDLLAALKRTSRDSLFRRFFSAKRTLSEKEIEYFMSADFDNQVALVATTTDAGRPVIAGGGR